MRTTAIAFAALLAWPALAGAAPSDWKPGPPLEDLLAQARDAKKPLLLEFAAVW